MFSELKFLLAFFVFCCLDASRADVNCNRRPEFIDLDTCCKKPHLITQEVETKCKEHQKPVNANGHPYPSPCFMSCALNTTGIFVNEALNDATMRAYLQKTHNSTPAMISIVVEAFQNCAAKANETSNQRSLPTLPKCPTKAIELVGCVHMTTFINCPASLWNSSQQCNSIREHMTNCKPPHGPMG